MIDISTDFLAQISGGQFKAILILFSYLGGIIASISPCSIAMLPIIIGYIGGYGEKENKKTLLQLLSFVLGTAIVFCIIGIICALTGKLFLSLIGGYFVVIMASLLMVMGLHILGALDINIPSVINKIPDNKNNSLYLYPMLLGMVFALAGSPCSTPILAGIIGFASVADNILTSTLMLFSFAIGQGTIIIIAGLLTNILKNTDKIANFSEIFMKFSGLLLIAGGIYLYYRAFSPFFT